MCELSILHSSWKKPLSYQKTQTPEKPTALSTFLQKLRLRVLLDWEDSTWLVLLKLRAAKENLLPLLLVCTPVFEWFWEISVVLLSSDQEKFYLSQKENLFETCPKCTFCWTGSRN